MREEQSKATIQNEMSVLVSLQPRPELPPRERLKLPVVKLDFQNIRMQLDFDSVC